MPSESSTATPVDHEYVIIGSGFSGLGMAITLRDRGERDFAIFERADSLGGTWRDNHYPGCACDVPAPLYSFSFAQNPNWSQMYAGSAEIRAYLEDCADRFDLRSHMTLGNGVASSRWDEAGQFWGLTLDDGSEISARYVVAGIGGLTQPSFPAIEGLDDFTGRVLHSAAWDDDIDLEGKRVAVIGTGASAIQLVPRVAELASQVDVFQRTPPWVFPQINFSFSKPVRTMFRLIPATQKLLRLIIWSIQEALAYPLSVRPRLTKLMELYARFFIRRTIKDPELRAKVTPNYRPGCKRLLTANEYYKSLNRENVDVITDRISKIEAGAIVTADGVRHEADILVCATGFNIRAAFDQAGLRGRGGVGLDELWADRIEAHRGTMISGLPNMFVLSGPNTGTGNMSAVFMIEAQIRFVHQLVAAARQRGATEVDVKIEAQEAFNRDLTEQLSGTVWLTGGCDSWYLTDDGHTGVLYPGFSSTYRRDMSRVNPDEFDFRGPTPDPDPSQRRSEPAAAPA